jgi:hypothetical protein
MNKRLLAVLAVPCLLLTLTGCPVDGVPTASPTPTLQLGSRYSFEGPDLRSESGNVIQQGPGAWVQISFGNEGTQWINLDQTWRLRLIESKELDKESGGVGSTETP